MRLVFFIYILSLSAQAQRFSKTDLDFGGANRPALLFVNNSFVVADEDQDSLGLLQVGLFDSLGNKVFHRSYDYYESPDSVNRVSPCFKCLKANRGSFYFAQTDFILSDSAYVRFTQLSQSLDTINTAKHLEFQGGTPEIQDLVFDSDSTFIVTGLLFRLTNYNKYDLWVAKFDTAFNPIWELRLPDTIPGMNGGYFAEDLIIDQYGSCLVTGRANHYVTTQSNFDHSFAARVDIETGQLKWFHSFNEDLGSLNIAALDNGNGTYSFARMEVKGFWPGTNNSPFPTRMRFGRIDTLGEIVYDTSTGPDLPYFRFKDLIRTKDGNFYVAGNTQVLPGDFPTAAYKFTPQGDSLWMHTYYHLNDSADQNYIWAFQETPDSGFLHLGRLLDFNNDIDSVRTLHFYMLKTDSYGCLQEGCQSIGMSEYPNLGRKISVYPNPTKGQLFIQSQIKGEIHFKLWNAQGQVVRGESFRGQTTLDLAGIKPGVYYLSSSQDGLIIGTEKIVVGD